MSTSYLAFFTRSARPHAIRMLRAEAGKPKYSAQRMRRPKLWESAQLGG